MSALRAAVLPLLLMAAVAAAAPPSKKRFAPVVLDDVKGHAFDFSAHLGKRAIVVAFWATWCKPCKIELAALSQLYEKRKARGDDGLLVVAVSIDGPKSIAEIESFVSQHGYTFPVVLDKDTSLLERYNPRGDVPFSLVIDKHGQVVETHQGYNPGDEIALEARLEALIAEPDDSEAASKDVAVGWDVADPGAHVEGTESLQVRYLHDNYNEAPDTAGNTKNPDDRVTAILNRLTLGGGLGPFGVGVRVDNTLFPGYDRADRCTGQGLTLADCPWEDDHRIERYWVQWQTPTLEVRLGDFYGNFGQGMVFSVRKIDEIGIDTAIRGARIKLRRGPVALTALGGLSNVQNVDLISLGTLDDPNDLITGFEGQVELPHRLSVAVRGLFVDYGNPGGITTNKSDLTLGASFEAKSLGGYGSLYVEGAWIDRHTRYRSGRTTDPYGYGLYGRLSLIPSPAWSIVLEWKDYRRFDLANRQGAFGTLPAIYHEAPTLERFDQQVQTNANATGGRLLVQVKLKPADVLLYANFVGYGYLLDDSKTAEDDLPSTFDDKASHALHGYVGVEKRWSSGYYLNVSGGYRYEAPNQAAPDAMVSYLRRFWHVEADVQIPLVGPHALGVRADHRTEQKYVGKDNLKDFVRGSVAITYSLAPALSLALLWTYQTEQSIQNPKTDERIPPQWENLAGEVVWRFANWGHVSLYGGRNTGGIICVSGVCRYFPPFFGGKAEFVARF